MRGHLWYSGIPADLLVLSAPDYSGVEDQVGRRFEHSLPVDVVCRGNPVGNLNGSVWGLPHLPTGKRICPCLFICPAVPVVSLPLRRSNATGLLLL